MTRSHCGLRSESKDFLGLRGELRVKKLRRRNVIVIPSYMSAYSNPCCFTPRDHPARRFYTGWIHTIKVFPGYRWTFPQRSRPAANRPRWLGRIGQSQVPDRRSTTPSEGHALRPQAISATTLGYPCVGRRPTDNPEDKSDVETFRVSLNLIHTTTRHSLQGLRRAVRRGAFNPRFSCYPRAAKSRFNPEYILTSLIPLSLLTVTSTLT